jgi:hypothetical protein
MVIVTAAGLLASGCVAKTAYKVATAPVRATAKVIDWTTTSQAEADRNRGRAIRKAEERERKERRRREREERKSDRGS